MAPLIESGAICCDGRIFCAVVFVVDSQVSVG